MTEQAAQPEPTTPIKTQPQSQREAEIAELAEHIGYTKAVRIVRGQTR